MWSIAYRKCFGRGHLSRFTGVRVDPETRHAHGEGVRTAGAPRAPRAGAGSGWTRAQRSSLISCGGKDASDDMPGSLRRNRAAHRVYTLVCEDVERAAAESAAALVPHALRTPTDADVPTGRSEGCRDPSVRTEQQVRTGGAGGARTHDPGIMSAHALCAVPQLHRRSSGGSVDVEYSGLTSPSRLTWRDHTPLRRPDGRGVTLLGRGWQSPRAQTGGELQRGVRGLLAGRGAASIAQARGVADQQAWEALASPPSVLGGFRRFSPVGLACLRGTTAS
jgi:hypothetical protein